MISIRILRSRSEMVTIHLRGKPGTRVAPRGASVAGGVGLKVTVTSYL